MEEEEKLIASLPSVSEGQYANLIRRVSRILYDYDDGSMSQDAVVVRIVDDMLTEILDCSLWQLRRNELGEDE